MRTAHQGEIVAGYTGAAHVSQSQAVARDKKRRPLVWAAIAVPAMAWAALYAGAARPLTGALERRASEVLGRAVTIDGEFRVLVTPFSIYLTAGDVRIANPSWAMEDTFFRAQTVAARLSTFDLLIGRPGFRALDVRGGMLDLERSRHAGKVNWRVGKAGTLFDLASLRQIDADDLTVRYRDFRKDIDTRLVFARTGPGATSFSGEGKIGERAFTLSGKTQSSDEQPTSFSALARTGGIDLGLGGSADGPLRLAKADLTVLARGGDFSELAAFAGISLPAMPGYNFKAQLGHAPNAWHFGRIEGRIGKTDLSGQLTLDQRRARPRIVARLTSRSLDMDDGMALLGLRNDPPPIDMAQAGLPVTQRLLPDADLSPAALHRFDAVIDYQADRVTGTAQAVGHLSLKLALVKDVLTLSPVTMDLSGGFVSSDIMIDGRQSPALARYDVRLSPTPMGRLMAQWGVTPAGTTAMAKGRIELTGRGDTLRETFANASGRIALIIPQGQLRTQRASTSGLDLANLDATIFRGPQSGASQINCGLVAFTVQQGIATADPILIDTADNLLTGHGRIDLRDETIDLRLSADGKSFAFLSRPTPVNVSGTFASPLVTREPISWLRPASIFGLAMNLPDLAAIFSFVDPGEARSAACGPILRGAPGDSQRERAGELASLR